MFMPSLALPQKRAAVTGHITGWLKEESPEDDARWAEMGQAWLLSLFYLNAFPR